MIFFHGTSKENWKLIQESGVLYGINQVLSNDKKTVLREFRLTYLATDFDEACCYGDVVLAVNYDPYKPGANCNSFDENCWQLRVYEPIPISDIKPIFMERFVRIGDIPLNEMSGVYRGETLIGHENGVSVYRAMKVDKHWHIIMPSPLRETTILTLLQMKCMLETGERKAFLCEGNIVGEGHDGEPLLKNVKILKDISEDIIGNLKEIKNENS